uniref:Uncharacterized protein n=1 Tax=Oncorhynchus mykiss TaxID=8022 RepID=A0A8C7WG17_ONCMY
HATSIQLRPENYVTAPFEARFPNTNQAQNCFQNHLDLTRLCQTKGQDVAPSEWYQRVYKSLCPLSWVHSNQLNAPSTHVDQELNRGILIYWLQTRYMGIVHRVGSYICLAPSPILT